MFPSAVTRVLLPDDAMEVTPSRQWAKRVWQEQTAALRSSPVLPGGPTHTREARLRLEIDLALRARGLQRLTDTPRTLDTSRTSRSSRRRKEQQRTSQTALPIPQLPPLAGSQVATTVAEAGSLSSRLLQSRCHYKNMESPLPFFNNS